jgi:holo-[acyl-carrier protein] synthase
MIVGVGTDLIEIERVTKAIKRNDRFLNRMFSDDEQAYFALRKFYMPTIAANFAGKEAVLKVFGTGIRDMAWREIEILRDELGKPYVRLSGRALGKAQELGIDEFQISLSHSKENALAFAIGIKK